MARQAVARTAAAAATATAAAQRTKVKRFIWAGSFAAITIVGTIYGAGLKSQQEYKSEVEKYVHASVEEQIAILERRKQALVSQKAPLEEKLAALRGRMAEKNREKSEEGRLPAAASASAGKRPEPPPATTVAGDPTNANADSSTRGRGWWSFR
ncbi:hypothetical protein MAPG_10383 [Magnaporthiopsis poae ATCC 64411]|uniref:Uncharacterized protein n=1 Tax=Magnaporthiopsis poae (strain ATCC 64411 / 73-15) TaxID=644358 RepID=A0A0C4ECF9_MAGP6|nr:hypothetical protein MAPG_10383 [Magnaporthiopsis poae ATCC 64411]